MDLNFPAVKNVSPDPIPFQLRLDFSSMTLAQPESTDNKCSDDQFIGKSELGQKNKQTNKQTKNKQTNKQTTNVAATSSSVSLDPSLKDLVGKKV